MQVSLNTTVQNRTKSARLSESHIVPRHHATDRAALDYVRRIDPLLFRRDEDRRALLYSIGITLLKDRLTSTARAVLSQYETELVSPGDVPEGCFDLLGSVYQYLNTKKESLEKGAF